VYDAMLRFYHGLVAFDPVQSHRLWIGSNVSTEAPGTPRAKTNAAVLRNQRDAPAAQ